MPGEIGLKILQKYVFRELLWTFLAVSVVLLVVMLGLTVGELLSDIADGYLPAGLFGTLVLLKMPEVFNTILPLAIFIAVIWGLGRLYRDQEMAVMRASGFSWKMLLRPLFNLVLPVAVIALTVGLYLSPAATALAQAKLEEAFRNAAEWGLQTGKFHVLKGGELVLYVEAVEKDGRTLKNVFIQKRQNGREQVWNAEKGYYWLDPDTGHRYLTLENGQITEGGPAALDFGMIHFSRNDLRMPDPETKSRSDKLEARPSKDILFSSDKEEAAELQWRLSPAIAAVVMGLLAIPLSHSAPREGRGGRVVLGILAYTVYANLLFMCRSWIVSGTVPVAMGTWWVHVLALIVALVWLYRQGRVVGKS